MKKLDFDVISRYNAGESTRKIAKDYNCTNPTIYSYLKKQGVVIQKGNKVYRFDENYFDDIDHPNKAYFLGLLAADGYISQDPRTTIAITITREDDYILESLKKELDLKKPLYLSSGGKVKNANHTIKPHSKLEISSIKMKSRLIELGITTTKSKTLKADIINNTPSNLFKDFLRGLIDGDGTIGLYGTMPLVQILGTKEILTEIRNRLIEFDIELPKVREHKSIFVLRTGAVGVFKDLMKFIYTDAELKLIRKYNKYLKCLEVIEKHMKLKGLC